MHFSPGSWLASLSIENWSGRDRGKVGVDLEEEHSTEEGCRFRAKRGLKGLQGLELESKTESGPVLT